MEGRGGRARDRARLLRLLCDTLAATSVEDSQVVRGLALLGQGLRSTAAEERVAFSDTVQVAARKIVWRHLGRLRAHDPGTRMGHDPEALHDFRVAVRRLRAALRVFAPAFPPRWREHLKSELQWLGQIGGAVRDLDVQLARIPLYGRTLPAGHRPGLTALQAFMETERTRHRSELLTGLDSRRYFRLLMRLESFALGDAHSRVRDAAAHDLIPHAGARQIRSAWRRLLKRGKKITDAPAPEDLHALRIRAKRLRYLLEFLQELTGKRGRSLVRRLVRLQDLLGAYHDAVVTAEFVHQYAQGAGAQAGGAGMLTLSALAHAAMGVAAERCREFQDTWRRFARKRTRSEFRSLVRALGAVKTGGTGAVPKMPLGAVRATPSVGGAVH